MIDIVEDYLGFSSSLICSVRYCLGRRTYMPSIIISYISKYINQISVQTLSIMKRDIIEHGQTYYKNESEKDDRGLYVACYGDKCDYVDWMRFLELIEKELEKRGTE